MTVSWAPAPIPATSVEHGAVLLLAFTDLGELIVTCDDGQLRACAVADIRVDLRFDYQRGEWVDVSGFGEDDADLTETPPSDDGGEEVPGAIPDLD